MIIEAARQSIGVHLSEDQTDIPAFTADILRLELVSNTGLHLTIIDLPRLISVSENEHDIQLISNLIDSYLESSRTIILTVVPASSNVDTQDIIQKARRYDRDGMRTVRIITKPDLINAGTKQRVARLAKNMDRTKLNLGFFLLKNPTPAELREGLSPAARKRAEQAFFSNSHIKRKLPKVREELHKLLERNRQCLAALGIEHTSASQIRIYLTQISADFQILVQAGVDGDYSSRDVGFFDVQGKDFANQLRAIVHLKNEKFTNFMREHGQTRKIIHRRDIASSDKSSDETRTLSCNKQGQILAKIAREHVNAIVKLVSNFLQAALNFVVKDTKVRHNIHRYVGKSVQENTKGAMAELNLLLKDKARQPITYNHYYTDNIQKTRNDQSKHRIQESIHNTIENDWNGKFHVNNSAENIKKLVTSLQRQVVVDITEQACSEAQNDLTAYYKISLYSSLTMFV
ncbi:dynamin GTPase [Penicillium angulare]|uniref:Dynamin GTPase n=1 Tax=Penicillium angulare TaxID=116970 RepID=A0A9W9K852_9EURO|nr:dynamin GTPase [Penicillium angulare]